MNIVLGETVLTCHKTGKQFIAKQDGISTNYARDKDGNIYSDEGCYMSLKDDVTTKNVIGVYANLKTKTIQGWKTEHQLGKIICHYKRNNGFCGELDFIEVRMFDGSLWKGKYKSSSMDCVTLRKVFLKGA